MKISLLSTATGSSGILIFASRRSRVLLRCDDSPVRRFAGAIRFSSAIRFFDVSFRSIKNSWLLATSDPQTVPLKVKLLLVDQN
jgi:hypothetical protein